jgi:hypothetical protein
MARAARRACTPLGHALSPVDAGDLERAGALTGAQVIWSQWQGYLREGPGAHLKAYCESRGMPFEIIHTSGHASVDDLKRLAEAVNPKALVPIHVRGRAVSCPIQQCCAPSGRSMLGGMTTFITGERRVRTARSIYRKTDGTYHAPYGDSKGSG